MVYKFEADKYLLNKSLETLSDFVAGQSFGWFLESLAEAVACNNLSYADDDYCEDLVSVQLSLSCHGNDKYSIDVSVDND